MNRVYLARSPCVACDTDRTFSLGGLYLPVYHHSWEVSWSTGWGSCSPTGKPIHRLCDGVGSSFAPCDEVTSQCTLYPEPYRCRVTLRSRRQAEQCAGKVDPLQFYHASSVSAKTVVNPLHHTIPDYSLILSASEVLLTWLPSYMKPFFNCSSASLARMGDLCGFLESASKRSLWASSTQPIWYRASAQRICDASSEVSSSTKREASW